MQASIFTFFLLSVSTAEAEAEAEAMAAKLVKYARVVYHHCSAEKFNF